MPQLSPAQTAILTAAAQHQDHLVLPSPLPVTKATARTVRALIKRGLIEERPAQPDQEIWREEQGIGLTLAMTQKGFEALGIPPEPPTVPARPPKGRKGLRPANPTTKQDLLISMLMRAQGASVGEISQAMGWQAHSVRGAISGTLKKKLGLVITSETRKQRGRVYRIEG